MYLSCAGDEEGRRGSEMILAKTHHVVRGVRVLEEVRGGDDKEVEYHNHDGDNLSGRLHLSSKVPEDMTVVFDWFNTFESAAIGGTLHRYNQRTLILSPRTTSSKKITERTTYQPNAS